MKFTMGKSYEYKREWLHKHLSTWHSYFAWLPTLINVEENGDTQYVWLSFVERKGVYKYIHVEARDCWTWEYREVIDG